MSEAAVQSLSVLRTEGSLRRAIVKATSKRAGNKATLKIDRESGLQFKLATGLCTAASLLVGFIRYIRVCICI
jgi:hypothetical protein